MLQRIFFFKNLFELIKDMLRGASCSYLGKNYMYAFDPPFEGLYKYLKEEKNDLCKEYIEIFNTAIEVDSDDDTKVTSISSEEPKDFFDRLFKRKKTMLLAKEVPLKSKKNNFSETIADHFRKIKKFTEDLFNENKMEKSDISSDNVTPIAASDDEFLNSNLVFKRKLSRRYALSKRMQTKKHLIQVMRK